MIFKSRLAIISALMSLIMLGLVSGSNSPVSATADHPIDQALLLMFSSHARLNGEVESALISTTHLAALSQQTSSVNEIDALASLYSDMIHKLRARDNYDSDLENRLVAEYQAKVLELQQKAEALEAARSQPRRRGGIVGFINRGVKALGRGTGWIMGKAMDGAGKVGIFAIEEVGPRVLKEAVLGGVPLNAQLIRQVARELLIKRVRTAGENHLLRLAERINRGRAAKGEAVPTLNPVDATEMADFMEAFEEGDENQPVSPAGSSGGSSAGDSSGADVVVYDFTLNDAIHDWQSWSNEFGWSTYWIEVEGTGYCLNQAIKFDQASIHLEFNKAEMTVSGYIEASGQEKGNSTSGNSPWNASASARVEFEDLPGDPDFTSLDYIAWSFVGTGYGTGSISGTVTCRQYDESINDSVYIPTSAQLTHDREEYYIRIDLYQPSEEVTLEETIEVSGGNGYGSNGWGMGWSLDFKQPIDVPPP